MKNLPRPGPHSVPTDIVRRARGAGSPGMMSTGGAPLPFPGAGRPSPSAGPGQLFAPVPWQVRPPGSREIQIDANGAGYNNVTTPAVIAGSAFPVPQENVGIIRSVTLNLNGVLATTAIQWAFRLDGVPVEGWNALTIFPRAAASVSITWGPGETYIPIGTGQTIDVLVTVLPADGATYAAGITYHGWTYPKRLADAFSGLYAF